MDKAIKQQIVNADDNTYVTYLSYNHTGYLGVTTHDLLDHLIDWYGKILPMDIEENDTRYNEPVDRAKTIDKYFKQLNDSV